MGPHHGTRAPDLGREGPCGYPQAMLRAALGIMAHNEAVNLHRLLGALSSLPAQVDPILVVSSGSTDGTGSIARSHGARDPRIRVLEEPERKGKAAAINLFLDQLPPEVEVCVLVNGDLLPEGDAVPLLLEPFADPSVGMTGARPVPTNPATGWIHRVVRFQWDLHHRVALRRPKLGEMVAFRRGVPLLPEDTAVDEATLESHFAERGLRLVYVPDAVVHNRGPDRLSELLSQRSRIWAGHLHLRRERRYPVATYRLRDLALPLAHHLEDRPGDLPVALLAAVLEILARAWGTFGPPRRNPALWPVLPSTKDLG